MSEVTREDFEAAAKAANLKGDWYGGIFWICDCPTHDYEISRCPLCYGWRPHEDDDEAFRLMVDAQITIDLNDDGVEASYEVEYYEGWEEWADHANDRRAATRLAIFRAAIAKGRAELAKSMPATKEDGKE